MTIDLITTLCSTVIRKEDQDQFLSLEGSSGIYLQSSFKVMFFPVSSAPMYSEEHPNSKQHVKE